MVEFECKQCGLKFWAVIVLGQEPVCPRCGTRAMNCEKGEQLKSAAKKVKGK